MRVLVCGGRDFNDTPRLCSILDQQRGRADWVVIHGAGRGADTEADFYARSRGLDVRRFPAEWKRFGNRAGPIRNQRMLDEGKPDLVIAFPGGRGTADMIRRAKGAGVTVLEVGA